MRFVRNFLVLTAFACVALGVRAADSGNTPNNQPAATGTFAAAGDAAKPAATTSTAPAAPVAATREEVEGLRAEVAELKAAIKKLMESKAQPDAPAARVAAKAGEPAATEPAAETVAVSDNSSEIVESEPLGFLQAAQKSGDQKAVSIAGWNGEHFFIRSPDSTFQLQPYGYTQEDYTSYRGDASPANTFSLRRARFGFQGNYGSHFSFGMLLDAAATSGSIIRDVYVDVKAKPQFAVQVGQFKEPFAQELLNADTNIDFVQRGLQSLLYPSAGSAYRSPGITVHGDLYEGMMQYWVGAFNGKGYSLTNTTSVPEAVGRIRLYPWRKHKDSVLQGLAFGGSIAYSETRGLSQEVTLSTTQPDGAYTFFPQFRTNGGVYRYEGEFTYLHGPLALRGEYVQAMYDRNGVGTEQLGGLGTFDLPPVRFKGYNLAASWVLTGEKRPENGTVRVKKPLFGPETPGGSGKGWGAFEVAFRYNGIQGKEPGCSFGLPAPTPTPGCNITSPTIIFTPETVPTFNRHTDQFTGGLNWYLNYWVRYQFNVSVDRLKDPSTIGTPQQNFYVFEQRLQFRF